MSQRNLLPNKDLKQAIEKLHDCRAFHIEDVIVSEHFGSDTVWGGIVSVFKIEGHPKADKCYAWSSLIRGSKKRRYYAVLHIPPVDSPAKAVRASIVHDFKKEKSP